VPLRSDVDQVATARGSREQRAAEARIDQAAEAGEQMIELVHGPHCQHRLPLLIKSGPCSCLPCVYHADHGHRFILCYAKYVFNWALMHFALPA